MSQTFLFVTTIKGHLKMETIHTRGLGNYARRTCIKQCNFSGVFTWYSQWNCFCDLIRPWGGKITYAVGLCWFGCWYFPARTEEGKLTGSEQWAVWNVQTITADSGVGERGNVEECRAVVGGRESGHHEALGENGKSSCLWALAGSGLRESKDETEFQAFDKRRSNKGYRIHKVFLCDKSLSIRALS